MNKSKLLKFGFILGGIALFASCSTNSFCSVQDKANMMFQYENNIVDKETGKTTFDKFVEDQRKTSYGAPSDDFFVYIEEKVAETVLSEYSGSFLELEDGTKLKYKDVTIGDILPNGGQYYSAFEGTDEYNLTKYAKANATNTKELWSNYTTWRNNALDVKTETNENRFTISDIGSDHFFAQMKKSFNSYANGINNCFSPKDTSLTATNNNVDADGNKISKYNISIEGKTWGEAFQVGFIEGLLVYPIGTLLYYLSIAFSSLGWFGIVLAIFLVTIIVRGVLFLLTFKQTMSQQRMTDLQPEMEKLSQKYPNANTNQSEKQALAQEQMALYKKHKVNPFGMFIVLIFQFPIFIAVWGAMSQSAVLKEGSIFGLQFSDNFFNAITHWGSYESSIAPIMAIIIFVLMAAMQATSMLLPQYLQKKRVAKVEKLHKNPSKQSSMNQMKIMNYVMLGMIIFMGATLPIAMAIYWFISALVSLIQSLTMSAITAKHNKNKNKDGFVKYKAK